MTDKCFLNKAIKILGHTCLYYVAIYTQFCNAEILSNDLSVISSADPQSNAVQSFIIIPKEKFIQQSIKKQTKRQIISQQTPFVIEYNKPLNDTETLEWRVKVSNKQYGTIAALSKFPGRGKLLKSGFLWQSDYLNKSVKNRQRLVFRPKPFSHQPKIYKKGRGAAGKRRNYGGGTMHVNKERYNPKLSYTINLNILKSGSIISSHKAILKMDKKDMIRQEYINHYNIRRYGKGDNGNIPIPTRQEISTIPIKPSELKGNPLTESKYQLIIDDGMLDLANKINNAYMTHSKKLKASKAFYDLDSKKIFVPNSSLWISSGWRNPERNEWYSNAVNGIHQRGGAIDFIIMAPSNSRDSAIAYWVLWQALEEKKAYINAYWQLEKNGRPMTTQEFKQDIEPKNGIPDAFDKADHLHANIQY